MKDPTTRRMTELKHEKVDQLSDEEKRNRSAELKALLRHWDKPNVDKDGMLCRTAPDRHQKQVVIPPSFRPLVYSELLVDMGHLGVERINDLVKDRFFWINMAEDIKHFTTNVCPCVKQKKPHVTKAAAMKPIRSAAPVELISMDFLHLEQCSGGFQYILVITNNISRFVQAYPTRNNEAKTAAEKLCNDFILRFDILGSILHDQGRGFQNGLLEHFSKLCSIQRLRTSPYHPQGNGQCERMNKTIINMFKTLVQKNKTSWKDHLNELVYAYNCTKHSTTGYSLFYLLFGRNPRLTVDLLLIHDTDETQRQTLYIT